MLAWIGYLIFYYYYYFFGKTTNFISHIGLHVYFFRFLTILIKKNLTKQKHAVCRCLADRALPQPERPPRQPECFPIRLGRSRNGALRSFRLISVIFYLSFRAFFYFTKIILRIEYSTANL